MQSSGAAKHRAEPSNSPETDAASAGRVLLVVEDDLIGADLADLLASLGYAVDDILTSASAALEGSFAFRSDVVVVDLELHGEVDPVEAGRLIGAHWQRPIVYLVDDLQQADRVTALGSGAPHVMWPFAPAALDDTLRSVLAKSSDDSERERRHSS